MARRLKIRDFGTCLNFASGSNNKVDCGTDFIGTGDITICAWINPRNAGETAGKIVDNGAVSFALDSLSRDNAVRISRNNSTYSSSSGTLQYKTWSFWAVTSTSAGVSNIYKNGVLTGAANQSAGTPIAATTNVIIGTNAATTRDFNGKIDGVRIFNRILTVAEIQDLYYDMKLPSDSATSMLAEYTFNEGGGSTAYDTSGNGRNGTITGATYSDDVVSRGRGSIQPATNCIDFSAATDELDLGTDFVGVYAVSISAWVNIRSAGGTNSGVIFTNGRLRFSMSTSSGNKIRLTSNNASNNVLSNIIPFNKWIHVVGTRALDGTANIFINAQQSLSTSQNSGTPAAALSNAMIGNRAATDMNFDGKIANLIVHNKVLSQAEISALYYNGTVPDGALYNAKFDNNLTDDSVYHRTATATGTTFSTDVRDVARTTVATGTRLTVRDFGTALQFDGSTTKVIRAMTNDPVTKWACSFWVKIHNESNRHNFVYRGNGNSNYPRIFSKAANNMLISCQYSMTGQSSQAFDSITKLKKDIWYHVVFTINGDEQRARLYINGVLENSQTPNGGAGATVASSTSSLSLGNDTNLSLWLDGKMDDFTLWRGYAPSESEVQKLYLKGEIPGNPYLMYAFNEGSGATAQDPYNNLDGTITAGTYTTDVPMLSRQSV